MTGILRLLLVVLLAVPVLVLSAPAPAHACSCAGGSVADYVEWSDAVFVATVAGQVDAATGSVRADVLVVYDGDVADQVTVRGVGPTSPCGLTGLDADQTWLFYGVTTPADARTFAVSLCSGSERATADGAPAVERLLGPGRVVEARASEPVRPEPDRPDDVVPPLGWVGLGLAAAVGLGGALVVRRRSARA